MSEQSLCDTQVSELSIIWNTRPSDVQALSGLGQDKSQYNWSVKSVVCKEITEK